MILLRGLMASERTGDRDSPPVRQDRRANVIGRSKRTLEILIDPAAIKANRMDIRDREDSREPARLERCLDELRTNPRGTRRRDGGPPRNHPPGRRRARI